MTNEKSILPFSYQHYLLRALSLLPIIFFLGHLEYVLYGEYVSDRVYLFLSACITIGVAFLLFKPIGRLFTRKGRIELTDDEIRIFKGRKLVYNGSPASLTSVEIYNTRTYGAEILKMILQGDGFRIVLYSADADKSEGYSFTEIADTLKEKTGCEYMYEGEN